MEHKYRVWDIPEQKMQYEGFCIEPDGSLVWLNDAKPEPDSYVLMQSTGLKDKNVWEGDIVKMTDGTLNIVYLGRTYTNEPYEFKLQAIDKSGFSFDFRNIIEVIGNIHEHKHLLEQDGI